MADKAGKEHWDRTWSLLHAESLDLRDRRLRNEVNLRLHRFFSSVVSRPAPGAEFLEVGCGRSFWLPYFAQVHGFRIVGLDYSEDGCAQERQILEQLRVDGEVVCADMFQPPPTLENRFDYAFSNGVVEHFTDTAAAVGAIARMLKPGGRAITLVPNMNGTTGFLQRVLDRSVYDKHVALSPRELARAHESAGMEVESSDYHVSTNYYVVSTLHSPKLAQVLQGLAGRTSMLVWALERLLGEFRVSRGFSPYVICVARKRG